MKTEKNVDFLENAELGRGVAIIDNVPSVENFEKNAEAEASVLPAIVENNYRNVPKYATAVWRHLRNSGKVLNTPPPAGTEHLYKADYDFFLDPIEQGVVNFKCDLRGHGFAVVGNKDVKTYEQNIFIIPQFFQELGNHAEVDRYKLFPEKGKTKTLDRNVVWWFFKAKPCYENENTGEVVMELPTGNTGEWFKTFVVEPKLHNMLVKTMSYGTFFNIKNEVKIRSKRSFFETIFEISLSKTKTTGGNDVNKIEAKYVSDVMPYLQDAIIDYRHDLGIQYDNGKLVGEYKVNEPVPFDIFVDLVSLNVPDFNPETPEFLPDNLRPFMQVFFEGILERGLYPDFCVKVSKTRERYQKEGLL